MTVEGRTVINRETGRGDPLSVREGLTNGATDGKTPGLAAADGLSNGITRHPVTPSRRGHGLLGRSRWKRRAAREAMCRKAAEPLPGADGG